MPEIVKFKISQPNEPRIVRFKVGFRGPPGPPGLGGAQISPAADNRLEAKPDGLFVGLPQYSSTQW
jgi:hypothetical protein